MKSLPRQSSCFHSSKQTKALFILLEVCRHVTWAWITRPAACVDCRQLQSRQIFPFQNSGQPPATRYQNHRLTSLFITTNAFSTITSNSTDSPFQAAALLGELNDDDDDGDDDVLNGDDAFKTVDEVACEDGDDEAIFQMEDDEIAKLPRGIPEDYAVVQEWTVPSEGFDLSGANDSMELQEVVERLQLTPTDVSLPVALMLILPNVYPTLSRARKVCRKGSILLCRGPASCLPTKSGDGVVVDPDSCKVGRVGDRVFPGDIIAKQLRLSVGHYRGLNYAKPSFDVPVIYQDDHFAAVNKPAGIVVYVLRKDGSPTKTIRAALPFCLSPPGKGTLETLRIPISVHRLDKPTSGILLCAKTRPAVVDLTRQFCHRDVKKTYVAIVNGIPDEPFESRISSRQAFELGVDVSPNDESATWQLINHPLDGKSAVTVWRALRYVPSLKAKDGYLTLVELKPKTGRYHQLRRHMAWVCQKPLVGDEAYDGESEEALFFRKRGLFLCANRATLEHPFYNTEAGRQVWETLDDNAKYANGTMWLHNDGKVMVTVTVDIPAKFNKFLNHEEERFRKLSKRQK